MLSPNAKETIPALVRVEERGKRRAKQESNNSKLLSLLIKMRDEMRRRDEQFREELRWRGNNQVEENKKREKNLATLL